MEGFLNVQVVKSVDEYAAKSLFVQPHAGWFGMEEGLFGYAHSCFPSDGCAFKAGDPYPYPNLGASPPMPLLLPGEALPDDGHVPRHDVWSVTASQHAAYVTMLRMAAAVRMLATALCILAERAGLQPQRLIRRGGSEWGAGEWGFKGV